MTWPLDSYFRYKSHRPPKALSESPSRLLSMSNIQYSTISPVLPYDVIVLIIDIVGENKDTKLLRELALVSHSFHQICSKHLFATVDLHDSRWDSCASSKKRFVELVKSRPNVVNYIRKLTYKATRKSINNGEDHLLSPILSNFHQTISHLNCLAIDASYLSWNTLDSSLTSAFLHLMSLPTINHIDLSRIGKFPLSSLTSSVNLLRLDMSYVVPFDYHGEDNLFKTVQSELMPKIREFHTSGSHLLTKWLDTEGQDGQPVFNFMDLRQLSMSFIDLADDRSIKCLLQNAKLLERLHLSVDSDRNLVGVLSTSTPTLKVLDLTVSLYCYGHPPLAGLCEELKVMAGHNTLESLSFEVSVDAGSTLDFIGSTIQKVANVLVKPGWSALRQVSIKLPVRSREESAEVSEALQSLPDRYLSHLLKLESVAFNYSAYPA